MLRRSAGMLTASAGEFLLTGLGPSRITKKRLETAALFTVKILFLMPVRNNSVKTLKAVISYSTHFTRHQKLIKTQNASKQSPGSVSPPSSLLSNITSLTSAVLLLIFWQRIYPCSCTWQTFTKSNNKQLHRDNLFSVYLSCLSCTWARVNTLSEY